MLMATTIPSSACCDVNHCTGRVVFHPLPRLWGGEEMGVRGLTVARRTPRRFVQGPTPTLRCRIFDREAVADISRGSSEAQTPGTRSPSSLDPGGVAEPLRPLRGRGPPNPIPGVEATPG